MNPEELKKKVREIRNKFDDWNFRDIDEMYVDGWTNACIQVLMAIDLMQEEIDIGEEE